jgi:hypothetical protein
VEGRVTNLDRLKSRPNKIKLSNRSLAASVVAEIQPDGRFELPNALPGRYHVELEPAGDRYARSITIDSANNAAGSVSVEMPSLPPLLKVSGRIAGLRPGGAFEVELRARWFDPFPPYLVSRVAPALPDGSFEFQDVEAGSYELFLTDCVTAAAEPKRARDSGATDVQCATVKVSDTTVFDSDVTVSVVADGHFTQGR